MSNLTALAQRQKSRMGSLQAERAELMVQVAAANPLQAARLQAEVGQLRETVGALAAYKVSAWGQPRYSSCLMLRPTRVPL